MECQQYQRSSTVLDQCGFIAVSIKGFMLGPNIFSCLSFGLKQILSVPFTAGFCMSLAIVSMLCLRRSCRAFKWSVTHSKSGSGSETSAHSSRNLRMESYEHLPPIFRYIFMTSDANVDVATYRRLSQTSILPIE